MSDTDVPDRFWESKAGEYGDLIAYNIRDDEALLLFEDVYIHSFDSAQYYDGDRIPTRNNVLVTSDDWKNSASENHDAINPNYKEEYIASIV